jgi:tetratricopeptide (TPR) repeat protein
MVNEPENSSESPQKKLLEVGEIKSRKPTVSIILLIIVVLLALWGLFQLQRISKTSDKKDRGTKQVNLTQEQQQTLEADVTDAEAQINKLPENAPKEERYRLYLKLASAKYNLGLYEEALAVLDKVKDENQDQPALWQRYALIYRDMGDPDKARDNAKRALDLDKTVPQYWLTYIETEILAREAPGIIKGLYQEALQNTANNIGIITAYAVFLEINGDKQGAIEQWQKAIEVFPQGKADYEAQIARLQTQ